MFVGHYGPSFAIRAVRPDVPLWVLFVAALLWSVAAAAVCRLAFRWKSWSAAAWVGAAVLSHWIIDWLVHRPDLPLYGNSMKVGLGLWNYVGLSLGLEVLVLGGGLWLYMRRTTGITTIGRYGPVVFMLSMLAVQVASRVGPLPPSPAVVAASALGAYLVFAAVAGWIDRQRAPAREVRDQ
jgi:hypothetical protein